MAKSAKELEQQKQALDKQWTLLKNIGKEWDSLLKKGKRATNEERQRLKVLESQYGTIDKLERKIGKVGDSFNDVSEKLQASKNYIDSVADGIDDLNSGLISVGNTLGKNNIVYKDIKNTQNDINETLGSIFSTTTRISEGNTQLRDAADAAAAAYSDARSSISLARVDLENNKISQEEFNKIVQDAYADFNELTNSINYSGRAGRELKSVLEAAKGKLSEFNDVATQSNMDETVGNTDELYNKLISVENIFGKTSKEATFLATNFAKVESVAESVAKELANWKTGTGKAGKEQEKVKEQVAELTEAYKGMHSSIADINKSYALGNMSEEQRLAAIHEEAQQFKEVASYIDLATIESEELRSVIQKMTADTQNTAAVTQKMQVSMQNLDNVMGSFSGIPAMSELNTLLKTNIKDTMAFKAAVFALGAALGKAAFDYFGAPIKAAMQADKERKQNEIDTIGEIAKLKSEAEFIPQQMALDRRKLESENAKNIAQAMHEASYAGVRAAHEFATSMKTGAAQFERAAKTALFGNKIGSVGYGAAQMQLAGISADKVASAMEAAASATGKMPTAKMGADMAIMAERTGQSVDDISSINEYLQRSEGVSAEVAMNLQEGMRAMADKAGVSLGKLMKEIADASKDALSYNIKSGKALAKQVAYANSIGVNFGDIAKAGKSMVLNYKDSIKAEMQLSSLLGEQVDLSEVRAKFAAGDTKGAMEALKAQGLDPATMDMFQQEALSQALGGLDLSSISKIAQNTGAQVGALEAGDAKKGNQEFLGKTEAAEKALSAKQAQISADSAVFDAKLSAKISEAFAMSDAEKKYRQEQNALAQESATLASKMEDAWKQTDAYKKMLSDTMKLDFEHNLMETLVSGLAAALGGVAAMFAGPALAKLLGFGGGGGMASMIPGMGGDDDTGGGKDGGGKDGGGGGGKGGPGGDAGKQKNFIQKIFDGIKSIVTGIKDILVEALTLIKDVGTQLVQTIGSLLTEIIKQIEGVGSQLLTSLTNLTGKFGELLNKVAEIIGQVANKIATEGMKVFNTVVDGLTQASNSLPTILGNLGKAIGAFFQGIGPGLLAFGEMMATPTAFFGIPAGAIVLAMMMGVAAALNIAAPAIEALTPLLIGLADSIGGTFVEMMKAAAPIIKEVFDGIATVIKTVGDAIVNIINAVTNSIAKFAEIDAMRLIATAGGIAAIAGALALFGGGSALAGIGSALGEFFGGDPVEKFKRFASIDGEALQAVANGVIDLGDGLANFDTGNLSDIPPALATLNEGIVKNLSSYAADMMARFGATIKDLANTLVTFAGAIRTINAQAVLIDSTTAAFDRLGVKLLAFPKLSDIQPAIDGIKAVSQASPTPESAQAFTVWNAAFTGFNQNMVIMSAYPQLVAQLVPMFEQLTGVTNRMGTELNLIAQVPFVNFLGLAQGLTALGKSTPTLEQAEAFSEWNEGFQMFANTAMQITGLTESLGTIATTMDATALAIMNLADAFRELSKVDTAALDDIPWIRMTAFSAAGGKIQLVQSANKSFNVTQDTAKNIETLKTSDKINSEKLQKDNTELIRLSKNIQSLITVLATGQQLQTAPIRLEIDGRQVTNVIQRRADNNMGQGGTTGGKTGS